MDVVILPEVLQFSFQVTDVPEERLVKVFTANRLMSRSMKGCDSGVYGIVLILTLANSYSCGDWRMKESIAM